MNLNHRLPAAREEYVSGHGIDLSDLGRLGFGGHHLRVLIPGTHYVGKTTEVLAAMRTQLAQAPVDVLFFDFKDRIGINREMFKLITSAEVVGLIGLAIVRAARTQRLKVKDAEARFDGALLPFRKHDYDSVPIGRHCDIYPPQVSSRILQDSLTSAGLLGLDGEVKYFKFLGGTNELKWGRPKGYRPLNNEAATLALVDAVNEVILTFRRPVVVVLDGLDQVTDAAVLRGLFGSGSALLGLRASIVSTADMGAVEEARAELGAWDIRPLFPVPVLARGFVPGRPYGDPNYNFIRGMARPMPYDGFLRDLAIRRIHSLVEALSESYLHKIAIFSGGLPGLFIMFLREWFAWSQAQGDNFPSENGLTKLLGLIRSTVERGFTPERGITPERRAIVAAAESPTYGAYPEDREVARGMERDSLLLAYEDKDGVWYYPHPILLYEEQKYVGFSVFQTVGIGIVNPPSPSPHMVKSKASNSRALTHLTVAGEVNTRLVTDTIVPYVAHLDGPPPADRYLTPKNLVPKREGEP